jgi:antitoxin ParD1/3/4
MATRNVNLTDALDQFVETQVASGSFQNASEVVRAGLRLLKEAEETRAARLAALNAAVQEGLDDVAAGRFEEVDDLDAYFDRLQTELDADLKTAAASSAE